MQVSELDYVGLTRLAELYVRGWMMSQLTHALLMKTNCAQGFHDLVQ